MTNFEAAIDLFSGSVGGACGVFVGQPMDTIKVKMQAFPHLYKGTYDCVKKIYKSEGFRGYYAGTLPSLIANVGSCASIFSSIIICPSELVKCKLQALRELHKGSEVKHSVIGVTRTIIKESGLTGLFTGLELLFYGSCYPCFCLGATWSREVPGYFFFFLGYEGTRVLLTPEGKTKDDLSPLATICAGGIAGMTFWTCVFPMDVIKSRIQVFGDTRSIPAVGLQILRTEGPKALYNGLLPSLLRTFPATAALFLAYENTKKLLNSLTKQNSSEVD